MLLAVKRCVAAQYDRKVRYEDASNTVVIAKLLDTSPTRSSYKMDVTTYRSTEPLWDLM